MVNISNRKQSGQMRLGGRAARKALRSCEAPQVVHAGMTGGTFKPLSNSDLKKIHFAALEILETVGIGEATPEVIDLATERGCIFTDTGRLCFPSSLVEDVLAKAASEYVVYSRNPSHADLLVGGYRVHYATSGEAVTIYEYDSRTFRPSTLLDLYDTCRLSDKLEYIHQFGQTVIPTEISDLEEHDLNVAYVLLTGTENPSR